MDRIPEYVVTIDEFWLAFLIGTVLPAVTAFVTQRFATGAVKSLTLLALSLISGGAASLVATDGDFELKAAIIGFFVTFVTGVASHFGLLKPVGLTGTDGAIARSVPGGLGSDDPEKVSYVEDDVTAGEPLGGFGPGSSTSGPTSWTDPHDHR